jgi:Uma2 family endonuclease
VAAELFFILRQYVTEHGLGELLWDVDLLFVSGQFLRPDILFVPVAAAAGVTDRGMEETPGLVVEVLSPHSKRIDRFKKPSRYRDFGVPEYWVVDPDGRAIERYRLAT